MTRPASSMASRLVTLASTLVIVLALIGATYQGIITALERRAFPHPGRLVDVGGYQLHIYCEGQGIPTVVLESPAGGLSAAWGPVLAAVARVTRVCAYDRAGLGWSEAGEPVFDPDGVAPALATLLTNAHERPPYVLVGHGVGTAFASLSSIQQPGRVQALVLVGDPSERLPLESALAELGSSAAWLARFGVLRASSQLTRYAPDDGATYSAAPERAFLNRPDHLTRATQELARLENIDSIATAAAAITAPVTRVELGPGRRTSILNSAEAARVADAIVRIVLEARAESGH